MGDNSGLIIFLLGAIFAAIFAIGFNILLRMSTIITLLEAANG